MRFLDKLRNALPGQQIQDEEVRGLMLKVHPSGRKSWMLYYKTRQGIRRRPKIGEFPTLSYLDARVACKSILRQVAAGLDPKGNWDKEKQELILNELFQKVCDEHWSQPRFIKSGWAKEVRQNYEKNIKPKFGRDRISEIRTLQIENWRQKMEDTPIAANRSLNVFSKLFNFAIKKELRPQGTNPCTLVKGFKEKKRGRHGSEEEIKKIGIICQREFEENKREIGFLLLLAYTGARPRSIEKARRKEIKIHEINGQKFGEIKFSGKSSADSGEQESIILPPQALALLEKIPPPANGTLVGRPRVRDLWSRITHEAGCPDLWIRDWRRTYATVGLSNGMDSNVIGELQNHKSAQTRLIYQKLSPMSRAHAANQIAGKMEKLLNGTLNFRRTTSESCQTKKQQSHL